MLIIWPLDLVGDVSIIGLLDDVVLLMSSASGAPSGTKKLLAGVGIGFAGAPASASTSGFTTAVPHTALD